MARKIEEAAQFLYIFRSLTGGLYGEKAMINESRCDSTRPSVDHGARRYRTVFHGEAGPHSDDHTSRSSSVYESDRPRIIVG